MSNVGRASGKGDAVRTLIVDDDADMRSLVRAVIELGNDDLEVVGEAEDGVIGLEQIQRLEPDVVVVDQRMPNMDGVTMVRTLRERGTAPRIIFFSAYLSDETVGAMEALHPCAIVPKDRYSTLPAELRLCAGA